jgi:hypothetical protein
MPSNQKSGSAGNSTPANAGSAGRGQGRVAPKTNGKSKATAASSKKPRSGGADSASTGVGGENLEKVRDILFGAQLRDSEKRFSRLEERLAKDVSELREETLKRLDSLEAFIKKEVQSLLERAKSEQVQRTESDKDLAQQVKDLGQQSKELSKEMGKRVSELDDKTSESDRGLREQILEQSKSLRDEVVRSGQELSLAVHSAASELRESKADRAVLADLFTEIAMRLTSEPKPPAKK